MRGPNFPFRASSRIFFVIINRVFSFLHNNHEPGVLPHSSAQDCARASIGSQTPTRSAEVRRSRGASPHHENPGTSNRLDALVAHAEKAHHAGARNLARPSAGAATSKAHNWLAGWFAGRNDPMGKTGQVSHGYAHLLGRKESPLPSCFCLFFPALAYLSLPSTECNKATAGVRPMAGYAGFCLFPFSSSTVFFFAIFPALSDFWGLG